eukprot:scaffold7203_cov416-Prasinococcus_capsulatus_cf.AAC.10
MTYASQSNECHWCSTMVRTVWPSVRRTISMRAYASGSVSLSHSSLDAVKPGTIVQPSAALRALACGAESVSHLRQTNPLRAYSPSRRNARRDARLPELGRPNHATVLVHRDKSVLLSTHCDAPDTALVTYARNGRRTVAGQKIISGSAAAHHLARLGIVYNGLASLGAHIQPDIQRRAGGRGRPHNTAGRASSCRAAAVASARRRTCGNAVHTSSLHRGHAG